MKAYMAKQYLELLHRDDYLGDIVICKTKCMNPGSCDCVKVNVEVAECG